MFDKLEQLVRDMQDNEHGVPVRSQKMFLTSIPAAFMGYDLIEWLMDRLSIEDSCKGSGQCSTENVCKVLVFRPSFHQIPLKQNTIGLVTLGRDSLASQKIKYQWEGRMVSLCK